MKDLKPIDRLRAVLIAHGSEPFTNSEIRDQYNLHNLSQLLQCLENQGEVIGEGGGRYKKWRAVNVKQPGISEGWKPTQKKEKVVLPGWRMIFPHLFTDPNWSGNVFTNVVWKAD